MITLGDLKTYFATGTVNQALRASGSMMGKIVHWVVTDIIGTADFWWNQGNGSFATVADTAKYFLSNRVFMDKVWGMFDQTNNRKFYKKDLSWFYDLDPTPVETGTPGFWAYVGQEECQAVPSSSGTMSIVSSSVSDTSIEIMLRGISGGIEQYEILTLNGTTPVVGTISWDANEPISINLESIAVGLVTATRGAVTISQIPPGHLRVQRPQIRLNPVPGSTSTIEYFFYKRSVPLVSDAEIVDLPEIAFKSLRYGIEEITYFLVGKFQASEAAFKKYKLAKEELISISERDVAGNEIKNHKPILPFAARLPETIDGVVTR